MKGQVKRRLPLRLAFLLESRLLELDAASCKSMLPFLLCLFGGAAGIGDLVKLDIKGSLNNNGMTYDAGHWRSISMSTDGSKVIGTSSDFIWTSTDGATTWTETPTAANDVLVTT